jgi:hypothetical protein
MMQQCQKLYFLSGKDQGATWREDVFFKELACLERGILLQRIERIEIPSNAAKEKEWSALVEKWSWGAIGERLRRSIEKVSSHGQAV